MYKVTMHKNFFPVPQNMHDVRDLSFSLRRMAIFFLHNMTQCRMAKN